MSNLISPLLIFSCTLISLSCTEPAPQQQTAEAYEAPSTTRAAEPEQPIPPQIDTPSAEKLPKQPLPEKKSVGNTTKTQNAAKSTVTKAPEQEVVPAAGPPSHKPWDALLRKYVSESGGVDYRGLQSEQDQLSRYLETLSDNPPTESWSRDERLAYWINAYNAFTVELILQHYPVSSIRDIYDGEPWDKKWIRIGEQQYSLNNIEHDIIRQRFEEPRIHFAVNCAARSCPPLAAQAFTAARLEKMLTRLTRNFLDNPRYNKISADSANVSKIFEWYKSDFGNINRFLQSYFPDQLTAETPVTYMEYDWALNEQ